MQIPHWGPPTHAMEIFRYAEQGSIGFLWISGTNPAVSLPDLGRIRSILKPACAQFCKRARELVEILSAGSIRLAGHYDLPTHLDIDAPTCDWDWLPQSHLAANDQANALRSCNIAVAG